MGQRRRTRLNRLKKMQQDLENQNMKVSSPASSINEMLVPVGHAGVKVFKCKMCGQRFKDMDDFSKNPGDCDISVCNHARHLHRENQAKLLVEKAMTKMKTGEVEVVAKKAPTDNEVHQYGRAFKEYHQIDDKFKNIKGGYYRDLPAAIAEHFQ